MAITRIGSWLTGFGGQTGANWNGTTASLTLGAAPTAGDVVLAIGYLKNTNALLNFSGSSVTLTEIDESHTSAGAGTLRALYWVADGSTTPTISMAVTANSNNTSCLSVGVFRGVDTAHVADVVGTAQAVATAGSSPFDYTMTGVTTNSATSGALVFACIGGTQHCTWTPQTGGWTEEVDIDGNNGATNGASLTVDTISLNANTASGSFTNRATVQQTLGRAFMFGLRVAPNNTATPGAVQKTKTINDGIASAAATASPAAVHKTLNRPAPTVTASATATPAAIHKTLTVPLAVASVNGALVAQPAAIHKTLTVPTQPARIDVTATPAAIAKVKAFPSPSAGAGALVAPAAIAKTKTAPSASISIGVTARPAAIVKTMHFPPPSLPHALGVHVLRRAGRGHTGGSNRP